MREVWKKIPGHQSYEASSLGRIRSRKKRTMHILKQHVAPTGHQTVCLDGITRIASRMIIAAFFGLPKDKFVAHKNGVLSDNRISNLEFRDRMGGKQAKRIAQINPRTNRVIRIFNSTGSAARALRVKRPSNISACANGRVQLALGYKWRFDLTKAAE